MENTPIESKQRLKILITAHELSPINGSECTSGWNVITRLGKFHDITVLHAETNQFNTSNYKKQIEEYISNNGVIEGVKFIAIPQSKIANSITRINKFLSNKKTSVGISLLYFINVKLWERAVFVRANSLLNNENFDIIHHFNHLSFREPGYLWKLDRPFVWGPTSGLSLIPNSFLIKLPIKELLANYFRNATNKFQILFSSRIHKAINKSSLIYYVTADDSLFFSKLHSNCINLLDIGCYSITKHKDKDIRREKVHVIWVGRICFLKALDLLLNAIAGSEILRSQLSIEIIGDGPQKEYYSNMSNKLELENINWIGSVSKEEVSEKMNNADILVHTSIKEAASAVILESLSMGLPVICHDAFGMKFSIYESCGIKIPFLSPTESILGFRKALEKLCLNRNQIVELGKGAYLRAAELSWDSMAETIAKDYSQIHEKYESFTDK